MDSNRSIILIGMPGAGKSTVGVLLAKRLGYAFLDTDILIQVREGRTLQELIREHGAEEFCRIEERHILSLTLRGHVVAPGGSVVYRPRAMAHLKARGIAVHLELSLEHLKQRLGDVDARGVVIAPGQTVDSLYGERRPLYRRYADVTVATDGLTPDQAVGKILAALTPTSA